MIWCLSVSVLDIKAHYMSSFLTFHGYKTGLVYRRLVFYKRPHSMETRTHAWLVHWYSVDSRMNLIFQHDAFFNASIKVLYTTYLCPVSPFFAWASNWKASDFPLCFALKKETIVMNTKSGLIWIWNMWSEYIILFSMKHWQGNMTPGLHIWSLVLGPGFGCQEITKFRVLCNKFAGIILWV